MSDITPPRRDELLTNDGVPTKRFIKFLESLTSETNITSEISNENTNNSSTRAQLLSLQQQVGSGNPLTWDETGFTWDSTKHSFDQTEA